MMKSRWTALLLLLMVTASMNAVAQRAVSKDACNNLLFNSSYPLSPCQLIGLLELAVCQRHRRASGMHALPDVW